jgi:PAS domain S-box-containing protein
MVLNREITARIKSVLQKHPQGLSITELVQSLDVNRNTAARYLENMLLSGQVEMRHFGMAKIYSLANRLPVSSVLSISSEFVMQLDGNQRIFYANDPLLSFIGVPAKDLLGKNIEYTPFAVVFENVFSELIDRIRLGVMGEEWRGELSRPIRGFFFFCRIAPTVFSEGTKGVSVLLEDISARKRDEMRIRESESRIRSIFKASPTGIGVVSDRIILDANDRLCQMTGYSADELIGMSSRLLYPTEETFEEVSALIYETIQRYGTGSFETRWVKKDGTIMEILLSLTPLDPADISGAITFTALDISERKRAEQALRESEDRYRKLVEISPDTVILHREGKIMYVNPAAVRLAGAQSADDLLGKNILDIVHPAYREEVKGNIAKDLQGLTTPLMELQILRLDGTPVMVEGRGVSTFIDGSPAVLVAINDVTERNKAGLIIKEREAYYRSLFESTGAAAAIVEKDTTLSRVNSSFERLSGYAREEIEGKMSWTALIVREDLEDMLAGHQLLWESENTLRQREFRFVRKSGEIRRAIVTISRIPGTTRAIAFLFDLTDRADTGGKGYPETGVAPAGGT